MLSTIWSAKQKSLQMCAELRHCQRRVTNGKRQRVPQCRTRDGKTSLSVSATVLRTKSHSTVYKRVRPSARTSNGKVSSNGHIAHLSFPSQHHQRRRSVVKFGVKVCQIKPSNCFRLHPTSMISKHSTIPVPDSL